MLRHSPWGKQKSPSRHSFTSRAREIGLGVTEPTPAPPRPKPRPQSGTNADPKPHPRWLVSKLHPQPLGPASPPQQASPGNPGSTPRLPGPCRTLLTCAGPGPARWRPVAWRTAAAEGAFGVSAVTMRSAGGSGTAFVHICGNRVFQKGSSVGTHGTDPLGQKGLEEVVGSVLGWI